jgi:prevent-host-death family protein
MTTITATEAAKNFGHVHDRALTEPVTVTQHGRPSIVMIQAALFERLVNNYREVMSAEDLADLEALQAVDGSAPAEFRWDMDHEASPGIAPR